MKFLSLIVALVFSLGMSSCAGTHKQSTPPLMSQKMAKRFTTRPDPNKRSIYDKDMKATLNTKKGGTAFLSRQKYGTKGYTGNKTFNPHQSDYKTGAFTSGKDKNHFGTEKFSQAGKKPSYANETFATKKSWFGKETSRDAGKSFRGSNDLYKTKSNRDALKSQTKNDRPKIIELDNGKGSSKSAYSEDQVKKIMGRD